MTTGIPRLLPMAVARASLSPRSLLQVATGMPQYSAAPTMRGDASTPAQSGDTTHSVGTAFTLAAFARVALALDTLALDAAFGADFALERFGLLVAGASATICTPVSSKDARYARSAAGS